MMACESDDEDLAMVTLLLDRGANLLAVNKYARNLQNNAASGHLSAACCCSREAPT